MFIIWTLKNALYLFIIFSIDSGMGIENSTVTTNRTIPNNELSLKVSNVTTNSNAIPTLLNLTSIVNNTDITQLNLNTSIKKIDKLFIPSVHLGTIDNSRGYETRNLKAHPFNNVAHFEFGNSAVDDVTSNAEDDSETVMVSNPQSVREQIKHAYGTDGGDGAHSIMPYRHNPHQSYQHEPYEEGYVTVDIPLTQSHIYYDNHDHHQHHNEHQHTEFNHPHQHHHQQQQQHQQPQYDIDPEIHQHVIYEKPSKYEEIKPVTEHYNYQYVPGNDEAIKKPQFVLPLHAYQNYYHENHVHPDGLSTGIVIGKPDTVVYLTSHRETSLTRTRKFPYKHYQPQDDTEIHLVKDENVFPPQRRQISPWHKIIHIIGAFLPLGLLIAALKPPNIIKVDNNNTDPNIVLPKLRGFQLPVEHKALTNGNEKLPCENRSICESILHNAEKNVKLIGDVLENFTMRSLKQDEERKRSEFNQFFEAIKKKDCNFIEC